jgi:BirA family transcriptional regulator, biotin operon repressor / biotin---[acetyl-CoA-carboxylase] ligase
MFPSISFQLTVLQECRSSQEELLNLRGQPGFHGAAVIAHRQTAGYGRRGRSWISGEGNLALSLGLELPGPHERLALLPFLAGIALRATTERYLPKTADLRLKWPNDLYLDGKKLGGLIAQARQYGEGAEVVLGIGVNLSEAPLPELSIALSSFTSSPSPNDFAIALLREIEACFQKAKDFSWLKYHWEAGAKLLDTPLFRRNRTCAAARAIAHWRTFSEGPRGEV